MTLQIDGSTIEIPEKYVEEYLKLMQGDEEKVSDYLLHVAETTKKRQLRNQIFNPETFEAEVIKYIDADLDIFRS